MATDNIKLTRFKDDKNKKPGPILVELSNVETKNLILRSARKLKNDEELKGIYINADLTESEAALEKSLRTERDKRNKELPEKGADGLNFGMHKFKGDESEKKFYWGIRNRELKKIPVKQVEVAESP